MLDIEIQYFYYTFIHLYFTVSLMHFFIIILKKPNPKTSPEDV